MRTGCFFHRQQAEQSQGRHPASRTRADRFHGRLEHRSRRLGRHFALSARRPRHQ